MSFNISTKEPIEHDLFFHIETAKVLQDFPLYKNMNAQIILAILVHVARNYIPTDPAKMADWVECVFIPLILEHTDYRTISGVRKALASLSFRGMFDNNPTNILSRYDEMVESYVGVSTGTDLSKYSIDDELKTFITQIGVGNTFGITQTLDPATCRIWLWRPATPTQESINLIAADGPYLANATRVLEILDDFVDGGIIEQDSHKTYIVRKDIDTNPTTVDDSHSEKVDDVEMPADTAHKSIGANEKSTFAGFIHPSVMYVPMDTDAEEAEIKGNTPVILGVDTGTEVPAFDPVKKTHEVIETVTKTLDKLDEHDKQHQAKTITKKPAFSQKVRELIQKIIAWFK